MKIIYIVILALLIKSAYALTEISEIMYNPEGSDNNREYIEIYSDEIFNFTNFTIEDASSQDILKPLYFYPSNYSLIVEEGFNYTGINASIYSAGKTIGNGLNNDKDLLVLRNGSKPLAVESYSEKFGANGNNKSLCKLNDILKECSSTPGYENSNLENYTLLINELLPDPEGYDNSSLPNGEWIELYNYGSFSIETEGLVLRDNSNREIIISKSNVINSTIINPNSYLAVYMNGFFGFLNNEGYEKVFLYSNNTLLDSFSYSETEESLSWSRINDSFIRTIPTPNQENKYDPELLESKIRIHGKDLKAKFGDTVKVKLYIQKGNTNKNSINLYIESDNDTLSKQTSFNLPGKFVNTSVTLPVQIKPNCNYKYHNGTYTLIASGFNEEDTLPIKLQGLNTDLCNTKIIKVKEKTKATKSRNTTKKEKNINTPKITGNVVYESSDLKTKKSSIYIFTSSLLLIIITLVLRL